MKDEITKLRAPFSFSQTQTWLPCSGRSGLVAARSSLGTALLVECGWVLFSLPCQLTFLCSLLSSYGNLSQNTLSGGTRGREVKNENRGMESLYLTSLLLHSIFFSSSGTFLNVFSCSTSSPSYPKSLPAPKPIATKTSALTKALWPPPPQLLQQLWGDSRGSKGRARLGPGPDAPCLGV